jgi:hypothetical protein
MVFSFVLSLFIPLPFIGRNGIVSTLGPGVASDDAPQSKGKTAKYSPLLYRLKTIL